MCRGHVTYLAQRYDEGVLQRRLVQDLPVHVCLEVLDEIAAGKELDGHLNRRLCLIVYCLYHQAKGAIPQHPGLHEESMLIMKLVLVLRQKGLMPASCAGLKYYTAATQRTTLPSNIFASADRISRRGSRIGGNVIRYQRDARVHAFGSALLAALTPA